MDFYDNVKLVVGICTKKNKQENGTRIMSMVVGICTKRRKQYKNRRLNKINRRNRGQKGEQLRIFSNATTV